MSVIRVTINSDTWLVRRLSSKEFKKYYGTKDIAMTIYDHRSGFREIHFSPGGLQIGTIRHEVYHAYFSYHNVSRLSKLNIEECNADLVGSKLKYIDKISNRISRCLRS